MKNENLKNAGIAIVFILLLLAVIYFWQLSETNKDSISNLSTTTSVVKPTPTVIIDNTMPSVTTVPTATVTPTATPTPTKDDKPVIVFTPNGLFTQSETSELYTKYINPFTDYNQENSITTVSITIEKPTPEIAGYKYKISYINKGGSNGGFLYGTKSPLEWWLPECLGGCNLSDSFKTKYPEIAKQVE